MEYRLIDVKDIKCVTPRSAYYEEDLNALAISILEVDGLLRPIILKSVGLDSYELIEGDFYYLAAVVARELNPRKGEMINCFVVTSKEEGAVLKQLGLLGV